MSRETLKNPGANTVDTTPASIGAEPAISRTGAVTGQTPILQAGGSVAFTSIATPQQPFGAPVTARTYRPDITFYNASGTSLRLFRAGLAKAQNGEGRAHIMCVGDSITQGYRATGNMYDTSWVGRVRARIAKETGVDPGSGLISPLTTGADTLSPDNRYAYTSGTWSSAGGGMMNREQANSGGGVMTFTPPLGTDLLRIRYLTLSNAGPFSYTIDGGTATTVTPATTTGVGLTDITLTAGTAHTVVLTNGATYFYFAGVEMSKNGLLTGVSVHNQGYGGTGAGTFASEISAGSGINYTGPQMVFDQILPCLTFVAWGTNELNGSTAGALTASQNNLQTIITKARAIGSDVVLVSTFTSTVSGTMTEPQYTQMLYGLADTNNICILDLNDRYSGYTGANASGLMYDGQHPNNRGYFDIGTAIAKALIATCI